MAHGMELTFNGYPTINLEGWLAIMPIGGRAHTTGTSANTPGRVSYSMSYSMPYKSGATITATGGANSHGGQTSDTRVPTVTATSVGSSSASITYQPEGSRADFLYTGSVAFATADQRHLSDNSGYGIFTNNNGVSTVLNNQTPPMIVRYRDERNVSANYTGIVKFSPPELNKNLHTNFATTVYVGCRNNEAACHAFLFPKDGDSFASGADVYVRFFSASQGHGSRIENYGGNAATKVYCLVADVNNAPAPSGHGIAIYNSSGALTMSDDAVPVLCKGVVNSFKMPYNYNGVTSFPYPTLPVSGLSGNLTSSDTFLFQVGTNLRGGYMYVTSVGAFTFGDAGQMVSYVSGSNVRTSMVITNKDQVVSAGAVGWKHHQNDTPFLNTSVPLLVVRGEDYFTSLS
ncbi:hypothetical protein VCHA38O209_50261 [Vibrio chagasii]|nr:hypothetical protein VCHA38O209_50261 [Vibrio chagasii]